MPLLTRWYLKSALLYLAASLALGIVLAMPVTINLPSFVTYLNPAYFHLFLVG